MNDDDGLFTNPSVIQENFETWIKMATDNKINSSNSWNFALIDYFHDLNVLMDSENKINFQKASATLDGCVKIYSSRVDSVSNETGKLLSGLAQKNQEDNDGSHDSEEDEQEQQQQTNEQTTNKNKSRSSAKETTLVKFKDIKMKQIDQEFNIDPLFKKALVDFDEGGAASLLLNTLNIDQTGRVVFDASIKQEEENDVVTEHSDTLPLDEQVNTSQLTDTDHGEISHIADTSLIEDEILTLGMDFVKFNKITDCEISSSLNQLRSLVTDINKEKSFIETINNKTENFLTEQELADASIPLNETPDLNDDAIPDLEYSMIHEDDDDNRDGDPNLSVPDHNTSNIDHSFGETNKTLDLEDAVTNNLIEQDLMAYFDETMKKNWRGREHWKVRNIKKSLLHQEDKPTETESVENTTNSTNTSTSTNKSKPKKNVPMEIDFFNFDDDIEDKVFAPKTRQSIELAQRLRKNDSHYLLPDDYHFTSEKIIKLFIKPQQNMSLFTPRSRSGTRSKNINDSSLAITNTNTNKSDHVPEIADESFWAENYERKEQEDKQYDQEDGDIRGAHLENPFEADDDDNGIDFNQAFDDADLGGNDTTDEQKQNSLNIENETKPVIKDKKINFARVAKKVDVRKLKNNVWTSINTLIDIPDSDEENIQDNNDPNQETPEVAEKKPDLVKLKFSDIASEITKLYPTGAAKDISTSFQFICLLHLANEHGFQVNKVEDYEDLEVEIDKKRIAIR